MVGAAERREKVAGPQVATQAPLLVKNRGAGHLQPLPAALMTNLLREESVSISEPLGTKGRTRRCTRARRLVLSCWCGI